MLYFPSLISFLMKSEFPLLATLMPKLGKRKLEANFRDESKTKVFCAGFSNPSKRVLVLNSPYCCAHTNGEKQQQNNVNAKCFLVIEVQAVC
ncbi:hypothetical protein D3C86_1978500 [compost metagenome]